MAHHARWVGDFDKPWRLNKQPQDLVVLLLRLQPMTIVVWPQSHTHSYRDWLWWLFPTLRSTTSRPKR
jgi:hypothetical protein